MSQTTIKSLVQQSDPSPDDVPMYCFSNGRYFYNDNVPCDSTITDYSIVDGLDLGITDGHGDFVEYGDSIGAATELKIFELAVNSSRYLFATIRTTSEDDEVTIYFGDGTSETYSGTDDQNVSHDYGAVGTYSVSFFSSGSDVLTYFKMTYENDISFDLADVPSGLTYLYITGYNTVYGSIGDLPSDIETLVITGDNIISGELSGLPSGIVTVWIDGINEISGEIEDLPSTVAALIVNGSNSITGDIGDIPSCCEIIEIGGFNTVGTYTDSAWSPESMYYITLIPGAPGGLDEDEVDQLLIDIDSTVTSWAGSKAITLIGNNAARTSASDAAVTSLEGKGVTVTTS